MASISKNNQLLINIIASFIGLAVNMGVNFFLSPYIIENIGADAYGFVQLSNNLITYFSILTIALNSMSSRFISISYFKGDLDEASEYFTSTFFSNLILIVFFAPILVIGIFNIDSIIDIPIELLSQVQFLMAFMSVNFIIGLVCTNLGISYYVTNKLYLSSIVNIIGYAIRAILLIILFGWCEPSIVYLGIVTLVVTTLTQIINLHFHIKMTSNLKVKWKYYSLKRTKELIFSGIWNAITRLGSLLSEGLDLLITNIFLSSMDMGILAIAKTIPNLINNLLNTLISSFMPNLTELYARGNKYEMVKNIKQSMKIIGIIINIPIAILISYGDVLFSIWVPTQDAKLLQILSILTILPWGVMGQATIIHNIFTVINRIKINSILVCITGLLNIIAVYILLNNTELGLFAVAGVSSIFSILRNLLYTVPFGAIYINCKWYTFFPEILRSILSVFTISMIGYMIKINISLSSWYELIIVSILTAIIGIVFNCLIVLDKKDRKNLNVILRKYLNKSRRIEIWIK